MADKWEYAVAYEDFKTGSRLLLGEDGTGVIVRVPFANLVEMLDAMGNAGWELVAVGPVFYFKRPKG
jgi:hypothetical protein